MLPTARITNTVSSYARTRLTTKPLRRSPFPRVAPPELASVAPLSTSASPYGSSARSTTEARKPKTLASINRKYRKGKPLVFLTAYDATLAALADHVDDLDGILIGDSLGMVVGGLKSTVSVTLEQTVYHCQAVARGAPDKWRIGDLPFGSYLTVDDALRSSCTLLKEGQVDAVKLEGGLSQVPKVRALSSEGVAVVGHIGLLPQSAGASGGYRMVGKTKDEAAELVDAGLALEEAGAKAIVLECVPYEVAEAVTRELSIPTIGIGCGAASVDGQILVMHDMLGLFRKPPKFSKAYMSGSELVTNALNEYTAEVSALTFPAKEHTTYLTPPSESVEAPAPVASSAPVRPGAFPQQRPQEENQTHVTVIGGGAIGRLFATRLAASDDPTLVTVLTRSAASTFRHVSPTLRVIHPDAVETVASHPQNLVISAVSGQGVVAAGRLADTLLPTVTSPTAPSSSPLASIISLTNGGGHADVLRSILGHERWVFPAATYLGARMSSNGLLGVEQTGHGVTEIGVPFASMGHTATWISERLSACGLQAKVNNDPHRLMWSKVIVNSVLNPICALLKCKNGGLLELPDAQTEVVLHSLAAEAYTVALADGATFEAGYNPVDAVLETATSTASNRCSLLTALEEGRPTELDYINGFIVNKGRELGIPTPAHEWVTDQLIAWSSSDSSFPEAKDHTKWLAVP